MTNNKKLGNELENRVCRLLADAGCWVTKLTQDLAGQPADIIACKDGKVYLIDCKYCENDVFSIHRIEPNQYTSMTLFANKGNGEGLFVLGFSDQSLYVLPLSNILAFTTLPKKVLDEGITDYTFETWRKRCLK